MRGKKKTKKEVGESLSSPLPPPDRSEGVLTFQPCEVMVRLQQRPIVCEGMTKSRFSPVRPGPAGHLSEHHVA